MSTRNFPGEGVKGDRPEGRGFEYNWGASILCKPRVIMMMNKLVGLLAGGETEVLWENLPQCRFVNQKPHILSGREAGPQQWEASD
jgi:hypothetical protein